MPLIINSCFIMTCFDGIVRFLRSQLARDGSCQDTIDSTDLLNHAALPSQTPSELVARPSETVSESGSNTDVEQDLSTSRGVPDAFVREDAVVCEDLCANIKANAFEDTSRTYKCALCQEAIQATVCADSCGRDAHYGCAVEDIARRARRRYEKQCRRREFVSAWRSHRQRKPKSQVRKRAPIADGFGEGACANIDVDSQHAHQPWTSPFAAETDKQTATTLDKVDGRPWCQKVREVVAGWMKSALSIVPRIAQQLYKAGQKFMVSTREALAEKRARRHERDLLLWIESGVTPSKCNCITVALDLAVSVMDRICARSCVQTFWMALIFNFCHSWMCSL